MVFFQNNFIIFLIIFQNFIEIQPKAEDNFNKFGFRLKSVKWESDNKTSILKYCYLKAVSRKIVTFNFGVKLLVPFKKPIYAHGLAYYRYGTIFRQIIELEKRDLCSLLEGADQNPLGKLLFDIVLKKAPKMVQKCPFSVEWDLRNFTVDLDLINNASMMASQGTYRLDMSYFLKDISTFNVSLMTDITSPFKESFG